MNIFYLDRHTQACAEMHNDKHCVKMILEYAQLLSTAHRIIDGVPSRVLFSGRQKTVHSLPDSRDGVLYSATHVNHPSAVWVRKARANYAWLQQLLAHLCKEYTHRYDRLHKVESSFLLDHLYQPPHGITVDVDFTEPPPAMPDEYKVLGDSIASYRNYYLGSKYKMSRWTNREMPSWFADGIYSLYGDTCYIEDKPKLSRTISMPLNHANV